MICKICGDEFNSYLGLGNHIRKSHNMSTKKYYDKYLKKEDEGICKTCKKCMTSFISLSKGYKNFCSAKCSSNNSDVKDKRRKTNLKKYGTTNVSQVNEIKEKVKQTCLDRYGVDSHNKLDEIKKKKEKVILEKYGVKNVFQLDDIKNKAKNTSIKKYGVESPNQSDLIKNKKRITTLNNYGTEYIGESEAIKDKIKDVNLKKYGKESYTQTDEFKYRFKQTCLNKYGSSHFMKNEIIKNKVHIKLKDKFLNNLGKILDYLDLELLDDKYINCGYKHLWRCTKCGTKFYQLWNVIQQGYTCPICNPRKSQIYSNSKPEKELTEFIELLGFKVSKNLRNIISPYELDIFINDKNIAIEYDGLYWHSDEIKNDKNYHLNKTNLCKEKGIRLIHIFEDEWLFKKDIVKERLKYILQKSNTKKIHGRKCEIKEIDPKIKNEFLDNYHIQGQDKSVIKLGAFYNNELISVMTFSHGNISKGSKSEEKVWELNRYTVNYNYHVPGIASKLLTYFKRNYEWNKIFTFADKRWNTGELYNMLGFKYEYDTSPNYWYIKDYKRIHRFNLRKKETDPKDVPEWVLRRSEGFLRIWDCGNMKFVIKR